MFTNASGPAHWVFNAQDLADWGQGERPLRGRRRRSPPPPSPTRSLRAVKATFTAKVTSSTIYYAHVNDMFTWTVYDNGEGF